MICPKGTKDRKYTKTRTKGQGRRGKEQKEERESFVLDEQRTASVGEAKDVAHRQMVVDRGKNGNPMLGRGV